MEQINTLGFLNTVEHVKYAKPSCCALGVPQSSQTAAEHMFRHALICLIFPLPDGIDRQRLIIMALTHNITDFRSWDRVQNRKHLNMDYLACNLPTDTAKTLRDYWIEYWDGETAEAQLSQELCAFEHLLALHEDGLTSGDQPTTSFPELQRWMNHINSSEKETTDFQNGASFGSPYWKDPKENMRLLAEIVDKDNPATSPLPFIRMARYMSKISRKGWLKRGMSPSDVESNASHSWGVALLCLLFSPKDKAFDCAVLGLVHDLGEVVIGDITPSDGIAKDEKASHEQYAQRFLAYVSRSSTLELYFSEFEACKTVPAQIAHEADSLECRIQAVTYILRYPQLSSLHEFLEDTSKAVYFQNLTSLLSKKESLLQEGKSPLTIIFVTGGPGVGKDTLCTKLAEELDFCHIPTGDLLRKEVEQTGSRYSKFIQQSIDEGFTVPARLMMKLLTAAAHGSKWLVNGFPRSLDQLFSFEQQVSRDYSTIFLDCSKEVLKHRLTKRAKDSKRSDDKDIERRLEAYSPGNEVELYLEENGQINGWFKKIDASGPEDTVYSFAKEEIFRLLKEN